MLLANVQSKPEKPTVMPDFDASGDHFVLCEVSLRDDGTIIARRIATIYNPRQAFNTVMQLNEDARYLSKFYQAEFRPGLDS